MGQSASQAHAFYRDVAKTKTVWTIKDAGGYPAPVTSSGKRSQPFWSTRSRIERIKKAAPDYAEFEPVEISWDDFRDNWLTKLEQDGLLVGVNWSGKNVTGYDLDPPWVRSAVEACIVELESQDND